MSITVVGGGPAGYVAAIRAAQLGNSVKLIENGTLGGTCLNRGCIPTKSLLQDLKLIHACRKNGFITGGEQPDNILIEKILAKKNASVKKMVEGIRLLLGSYGIEVIKGRADFIGTNKLVLERENGPAEELAFEKLVLCNGSCPRTIQGIEPDGRIVLTSDDILGADKLPGSLIIVGAGYIGIEFAFIFKMMGVDVTLVESEQRVVPGIDLELSRYIERILKQNRIRIEKNTIIKDFKKESDKAVITVECNGRTQELFSEALLLSVGRKAEINMNFATAGIEIENGFVKVDNYLKTTADNVYAAGDVIGGLLLAYVASAEGEMAVENASGKMVSIKPVTTPFCIFSNPTVASVGDTEEDANKNGAVKIGRFPFRANPKANILGEVDGFIKVIADKETDIVRGVHIIGPDADTLISAAAVVVDQKIKLKEFTNILQHHPSTSEALKEAFLDADKMAIHLAKIKRP